MKKKVFILGVNGFLGKALWKFLKKKVPSWDVYGLDLKAQLNDPNIHVADLKYKQKVKTLLISIKPDYIFHFAGGRIADKNKLYESNFLTTKYLFDAVDAITDYQPRIIIPGSAAEYGEMPAGRRVVKEKDEPKPLTDYGLVKLRQTNLGLFYATRGFDVVVARIFNIMGEGTPPSLAVGRFADQVVQIENGLVGRTIHTKGLEGKRDFLDISDVCQALLLIAKHGKSGQIYNICSGHPVKIRELLRQLLSYAKVKDIEIQEDKSNVSSDYDVIGSNAKMRSIVRWSPKVNIEQSLKNTLKSYRAMA